MLLDGVDLAPPEVMERLNSLGENDTHLFVHELPLREKLKTQKLVPARGFALICTATERRAGSHRLFGPFFFPLP